MGALNNSLEKSVGDPKKGAANRPSDVETVQGLLNIQSIQGKRNDRLLPISGYVDDDTQRAILDFQELSGQARSGLIAPDDATFRALSAYRAPNGFGISHRGIDRLKRLEGGYHRYLVASRATTMRCRRPNSTIRTQIASYPAQRCIPRAPHISR